MTITATSAVADDEYSPSIFAVADLGTGSAYERGAELDRRARAVALDALAGRRDAAQARWDIAALVVQSQLAAVHVRRFRKESPHAQTSQDLAEAFNSLLLRKIAGEGTGESAVDMQLLADGGSLSAWLAKSSQAMLLSEQRNLVRARRRVGVLASPIADDESVIPGGLDSLAPAAEDLHSDEIDERDTFECAAASFALRRKHARPTRVTHLAAMALCQAMNVEAPERVEDDADASRVREVLTADPKAASNVVSFILRRQDQEPTVHTPDVALVRMWREHPRHILEMLASADPRVAHTISLSAVTPLPPMDRATLKKLRKDCLTDLGSTRGAQTLHAVITAWSEFSCGMKVSEFYPGKVDPSAASNLKTAAERAEERKRFNAAVDKLVGADVTMFGSTAAQVDAELRRRFTCMEDEFSTEVAV